MRQLFMANPAGRTMKSGVSHLAGLTLFGRAAAVSVKRRNRRIKSKKTRWKKCCPKPKGVRCSRRDRLKQSNFEADIPDFSPERNIKRSKRGISGGPTILRTPKARCMPDGSAAVRAKDSSIIPCWVKSTNNGITWSQNRWRLCPIQDKRARCRPLDPEFWLDPRGRFWWFWAQRDYKYHIKDPRHVSVWAMVLRQSRCGKDGLERTALYFSGISPQPADRSFRRTLDPLRL